MPSKVTSGIMLSILLTLSLNESVTSVVSPLTASLAVGLKKRSMLSLAAIGTSADRMASLSVSFVSAGLSGTMGVTIRSAEGSSCQEIDGTSITMLVANGAAHSLTGKVTVQWVPDFVAVWPATVKPVIISICDCPFMAISRVTDPFLMVIDPLLSTYDIIAESSCVPVL